MVSMLLLIQVSIIVWSHVIEIQINIEGRRPKRNILLIEVKIVVLPGLFQLKKKLQKKKLSTTHSRSSGSVMVSAATFEL